MKRSFLPNHKAPQLANSLPRNVCLAMTALIAIALPFLLLPVGIAQRPDLSKQQTSEKSKKAGALAEAQEERDGVYAIQLVKDPSENAETLQLIEQSKLEPIKNQFEILNYVNVVVRISDNAGVAQISKRGDVVSIQPAPIQMARLAVPDASLSRDKKQTQRTTRDE